MRRRDSNPGSRMELENLADDDKRKGTSGRPTRPKVSKRELGADCFVVAMRQGNARGAKEAGHRRRFWVNWQQEEPEELAEGGSLQWVARAGSVERLTSGSVRGSA